ncbi:hypothetical protein LPB67_15580 [Undibacterium sp. Jales W-56]|uniref:hypothetical protein n=1 Tax=Undibacterium sp. Jales W-56 TaxID=2897325 RepID=UPI0021CFD113|nr:hypothetical protein [Undibacterium sp. Jales W-56]MCU6435197.1 hypothetical protein [Undibacterium sp. Jales W-56]
MKKTGLAKSDAKKLMGQMQTTGSAIFGNSSPAIIDKREQRKIDQALGLVPFAVKLNSELVRQLQERAKEQGLTLNEVVAEVLNKGLSAG